eukprot:1147320-Rhodomonas_salina.6
MRYQEDRHPAFASLAMIGDAYLGGIADGHIQRVEGHLRTVEASSCGHVSAHLFLELGRVDLPAASSRSASDCDDYDHCAPCGSFIYLPPADHPHRIQLNLKRRLFWQRITSSSAGILPS